MGTPSQPWILRIQYVPPLDSSDKIVLVLHLCFAELPMIMLIVFFWVCLDAFFSIKILATKLMKHGILGMDHRAIVWCHDLLHVVRKILWTLAIHEEETLIQRLNRVRDLVQDERIGDESSHNLETYPEQLEELSQRFLVSVEMFLSLPMFTHFVFLENHSHLMEVLWLAYFHGDMLLPCFAFIVFGDQSSECVWLLEKYVYGIGHDL